MEIERVIETEGASEGGREREIERNRHRDRSSSNMGRVKSIKRICRQCWPLSRQSFCYLVV